MREETVNGVTRTVGKDALIRYAHFVVDGQKYESASVFQTCTYALPRVWEHVKVRMQSINTEQFNEGSFQYCKVVLEAHRQAIEIAREWAKDEGKPIAASEVQ